MGSLWLVLKAHSQCVLGIFVCGVCMCFFVCVCVFVFFFSSARSPFTNSVTATDFTPVPQFVLQVDPYMCFCSIYVYQFMSVAIAYRSVCRGRSSSCLCL